MYGKFGEQKGRLTGMRRIPATTEMKMYFTCTLAVRWPAKASKGEGNSAVGYERGKLAGVLQRA